MQGICSNGYCLSVLKVRHRLDVWEYVFQEDSFSNFFLKA